MIDLLSERNRNVIHMQYFQSKIVLWEITHRFNVSLSSQEEEQVC